MVSGKLEDSLRHDIENYIEGRLSAIKQEITEIQVQVNESLTRLMERQSDVQLDGSVAASVLEHLRAAHEEGVDLAASESSRAKASSDVAIIKAAIAEASEQESQSAILKTLVNRASSFAPRIGFFVIKGEQATGWRARGFQGTVGDQAIRQISFPVSADTVIGEAAKSRATWSGGPHAHGEDHLILNRLGEEPPQSLVAIPLVVRNRTVAVLYADSAGLDSEAINLEALETLVRVSAMAVELLAARTGSAKQAEAPHAEPSVSTYTPTVEYAETPATEEPAKVAEPEQITALGDAVEEPPAEKPVESAPAESARGRRRYGMDVELPVSVSSDEERHSHNDARRFARLLVSEIKLYNEEKVAEGRSHNDLYDRLREYIDRSREMYDRRVKPEVVEKYDYFHQELVSTLAEGDVAKLGNAYPGVNAEVRG